MNNPLPRSNFNLRSLIAKPSTLREEIQATNTGLDSREEDKANRIAAQIIEESRAIGEAEAESHSTEESRPATSAWRIPDEETCGLSDPTIELDESQVAAVAQLVKHQYACLIGAAGTGKTTVLKYALQRIIYHDPDFVLRKLDVEQGLNIAMVAFTGMATQVMKSNLPEWMHGCCKTIHSLLEFAPEQVVNKHGVETRIFVPQRHSMRKLDHDIIIIDESSMLGLDLWLQILAACRVGTRIYMVGDLNQLPPIIGQPIFGYTLGSWPVFELTKVHRQKEAGANRIVEVAHQILNGKEPTFDEPKGNPEWRVITAELSATPGKAQKEILAILNKLRSTRINASDPDSPFIYNPYSDRVMTAGNGFDEDKTSAMVQQHQLNEHLALLIQPPSADHPRYLIDGGRSTKKFAVDLRVMATKNESPATVDRVTNGMAGVITKIERNPRYTGDMGKYGIEDEVVAENRRRIQSLGDFGRGQLTANMLDDLANLNTDDQGSTFQDSGTAQTNEEAENGGASSHVVEVKFDNGATRSFSSKAGVESLQLAFCSTVAKCQGSQFDTAIIICHHADKSQLSREWFYTAVTRAVKRVIILKTDYAVRYAIHRQRIAGNTLAEKIEKYAALCGDGLKVGYATVKMNVPLRIEEYDGTPIQAQYHINGM